MQDVIMDECELSVAANSIQRSVDKLIDAMNQYNAILASLQGNGIQDAKICAQLSGIAEEVAFCSQHLQANISNIGTTVNRGIERVADADKFRFPGTTLSDLVDQLLSVF